LTLTWRRAIALVNPTMRELVEMQYQFGEPFIVDSSKITNQLGVRATPVRQALADTLAEYRHLRQSDFSVQRPSR
jgi:hypothetical protein